MALLKNITSGSINGIVITGSLDVSNGITGSLFGTASWALNAVTASYFSGSVENTISASYALTASYALNGGAGGAGADVTGSNFYVAVYSGSTTLFTGSIFDSGSFTGVGAIAPTDAANPDRFFIDAGNTTSYNLLSGHGEVDNYLQLNIQNFSPGSAGSSDIVATADNGNETDFYIDMGINGSGYNDSQGIGAPNDAYLYNTGGDLLIGNTSSNKRVIIFNGGTPALDNARVYITQEGSVGINASDVNNLNPEALLVEPLSGSATNDFNNLIIGRGTINENYLQLNIVNKGTGSLASSDIVATNDIGTESDYYIDMGINSSNYSTPNAVGMANDAYLYSTGEHLHIGNASANQPIMFFAGGLDSEANRKFELWPDNQHQMSGSLNITGSLTVLEGITGSLYGTSSWAENAINTLTAISSSFAATASSADNFLVRGTLTAQTIVAQTITSSTDYVTGSTIFGSLLSNTHEFTGSVSITGSLTVSGNTSITGSLFGTSSWAENALTASYVATSSYIPTLQQVTTAGNTTTNNVIISGSLITTGSISILSSSLSITNPVSGLTRVSSYKTDQINLQGTYVGVGNNTDLILGSDLVIRTYGTINRTIIQNNAGITLTNYSGTGTNYLHAGSAGVRIGGNDQTISARLHVSGSDQSLFLVNSAREGSVFYISGSGNTGIGTVAPSKKLHLNVSSSDDGFILTKSGSANTIFRVSMDGTVDRGEMFLYNGSSPIFAVRPSSNPSYINTGNNFGVGTASPTAKLHISGSTLEALLIASSSAGPALFVSGSGNVGIGIATPTKRLEVYDSASGDGIAVVRSSVTNQRIELIPNDNTITALIKGGGNNKPFYITSWANGGTPQPLYFGTNYSSGLNEVRMTIDTSGSVGIGTISPSASLHISGSSSSTLLEIDSPTVNNILFVSGSGNVGIGTNTPTASLDVSGSARVQQTLTVGSLGANGTINLNRGSTGTTAGAIIQQSGPTELYNYQGSGINFYVAGATTVVRSFITTRGVGITGTGGGSFTLDTGAALQISSSTQGFLNSRVTTAQRNAMSSSQGLMVYVTSSADEGVWYYNSGSYQAWTRLLNDSGSQVITGSLTVTNGITGSLFGTASWTQNAVTSSYVLNAISSSYANFAVSSSYPIALTGSTIYNSAFGTDLGITTNNAIALGYRAGEGSSAANASIMLGIYAGQYATNATDALFMFSDSGYYADNADNSIMIGTSAGSYSTNANNSTFLNTFAGYSAPEANNAFFAGQSSGQNATSASNSSFIGRAAGYNAYFANNSRFLGFRAGQSAASGSYSTLLGFHAGYASTEANTIGRNNIIIGTGISLPAGRQDSINLGGIIFATGSYFTTTENTSFSGSLANGRVGINVVNPTQALDVSGSGNFTGAVTASTALISGSGTNRLTIIGSGSAQPIFTVQGSQGELFSITDSLSGSLFSVNDISGLPIVEVFSDNTMLVGSYLAPSLNTTVRVTTTNSGSFTVYSVPTASYDGIFMEYTAKSGSNARAGQFMAIWSGSSVNFTDNSTTDFGSTSALAFTGSISGSNMVVTGNVTVGSGWTVKSIIRSI